MPYARTLWTTTLHSSQSFLTTICEQVRFYLDDITVDAKFSNGFLVQNVIYPVTADILARLNLNQDNPILIRHTIALVADQEYYQLPPTVQEVWRVATTDSTGQVISEAYPRGVMHPNGPGWALEGNTLCIRPFPAGAESIQLWYVPNQDVMFHAGTGYLQGDEFVLGATPTLGLIDRRHNAYVGAMLRLIPSTGLIQERIIRGYDAVNRIVYLRAPFYPELIPEDNSSDGTLSAWSGSSTSSGGFTTSIWTSNSSVGYTQTTLYEIAPPYIAALWEAIAIGCALKLGLARNMRTEKFGLLEREYKKAMKTIMDNLANMQMRTGKSYQKDTVDNPANRYFFPGGF